MNLISIQAAADLKGVPHSTIRYWIKKGRLKLRLLSPQLVKREDVEAISVKATGRPKNSATQ